MSVPEHFAKSAFVSCIDDRLTYSHTKLITRIGGAFQICLAGGGLAFLLPLEREVALQQVVVAYKVNKISHVYIESHTGCGKYTLAGITFESREDEVRRLYRDLDHAAVAIEDALVKAGAAIGEVKIITSVVDPDGGLVPRPERAKATV